MTWQEDCNAEIMLWLYNTVTFLIFITFSHSLVIGFGLFLAFASVVSGLTPNVPLYVTNYTLESTMVRLGLDTAILMILTGYSGIFCTDHGQLHDQQLICPWTITIHDATKYKSFGPNVLFLCMILSALLRFLMMVIHLLVHGVRAIRNRFL